MLVEQLARRVADAHELAAGARLVSLGDDRRSNKPFRRVVGSCRFSSNPHNRPKRTRHRPSVPDEQNHGWRAVPWYEGPARVDHVREVDAWEELLNQLPAELSLHETVGRDLTSESPFHRERDD